MTQELAGAVAAVNRAFLRGYPGEVARALESLAVGDAVAFLEEQEPTAAAAAVERLTLDQGELVLAALRDDLAAAVVARIDPARAAALLGRLDEAARERRLAQLAPSAAREIRDLIRYPADSAGALMDPRARAFRSDATAHEVLEGLRAVPERRLQVVYVVDSAGRLAGAVPLQDVALAEQEARLDALVRGLPASVPATAGRHEVIEEFETRRAPSLPVVDAEGRMLGVIRQTALVGAAQEEASVDLQTMVGASRDERALSPSLFAVRRRLPWLQVNLLTAFVAASVVATFEGSIAALPVLAVFMPVVAGMGGNAATQTLTVIVRGIALGELTWANSRKALFKEAAVGIGNGVACGMVGWLVVWIWKGDVWLGAILCAAMIINMFVAATAGTLIPLALRAMKVDPALASSVFITTLTDVFGFASWLGLSALFLKHLRPAG